MIPTIPEVKEAVEYHLKHIKEYGKEIYIYDAILSIAQAYVEGKLIEPMLLECIGDEITNPSPNERAIVAGCGHAVTDLEAENKKLVEENIRFRETLCKERVENAALTEEVKKGMKLVSTDEIRRYREALEKIQAKVPASVIGEIAKKALEVHDE